MARARQATGIPAALLVALLGGCQAQSPAPAPATATAAAGVASDTARPVVERATAEAVAAIESPANLPAGVRLAAGNFSDSLIGLQWPAPAGMRWQRDSHPQYLTPAGWSLFAPAGQAGTPLAALQLEGSNEITAAELRIGRSDDPQAMAGCMQPPAEAQGTTEPVVLAGVDFVHFHVADAAMSHYLQVDGYRGVRHGQCVAIDLVISGTRPEVYDPPRQAPFAVEQAQARLREALAALQWVEPGGAALVQ